MVKFKRGFLKKVFAVFFMCVLLALYVAEAKAGDGGVLKADEAEFLYKGYGDAVYQVEVIDIASGKKTSIGSGFQISQKGMMATNYHVVAEAIHRPESNRVEFLNDKDARGNLKILYADIVNDLAILQMNKAGKTFLSLDSAQVEKGTKIFSIGNPHDIGFTIIEGTYNGIAKEGLIDKIHFSGSLNPGMSGGPAISHTGSVVGINVATAGNQISFLMPVKALKDLVRNFSKKPKGYDFIKNSKEELESQLIARQEKTVANLLNKKWTNTDFGLFSVPAKIGKEFKCWGGANHKEKDKYRFFNSMCSNQDSIFIDKDFDTGAIAYRYDYIEGKKELNLLQFYDFYEGQYGYPDGDYKNATENDVTNFECNDSFINAADHKWKASFCVRKYKNYPHIFDMQFYMAKVGAEKKGFSIALIAQGISKDNSIKLSNKFIESIREASK